MRRDIRGIIRRLIVLTSVIFLVVGCSNENIDTTERDENVETIETYLENELTGPSDELKVLLKDENPYPPELDEYLQERYNPLVADFDKMVSTSQLLNWLREAAANGYELKTSNIEVEKIKDIENDAYDFEVKVEYTKNDQTDTTSVTGTINMNEEGKITTIRNINDNGLLDSLRQ